MAISQIYYHILKSALQQGALPKDASILELGEANWYGDFPVDDIVNDIKALINDENEQRKLIERLRNTENPVYHFDVAKVIYHVLFKAKKVISIDLGGTSSAIKSNLNEPIEIDGPFDVTINNGTAEHIFNIGNLFKTIHEQTATMGIMIHESPFTGWYNHGFYNIQPTLYYDVAAINGYHIMGFYCCGHNPIKIMQINNPVQMLDAIEKKEVPAHSVLIVIMKKIRDAPFVYPMQGYYDNRLDEKQKDAWSTFRTN